MKKRKRFEIIECSGTPYEIGKQYGQAARENILISIDDVVTKIKSVVKASKEEILANTGKYLPFAEKFDPELIEMLKGEADGAGVTFAEVFALWCWFELDYYPRVAEMCTSFAVTGKATKGGKTIIGQNFDVHTTATLDVVRTKHQDGIEQLSVVFWGGGELTITSAGLGIVLNFVFTPELRLAVPCCFVMHRAMRQKRMGDALGVLCTSGRSTLHYMTGCREGEIFSVETTHNDFSVIQPTSDVLVHTNHFLTERLRVGTSNQPSIGGGTYLRQQRLERLIHNHYGDVTPEQMMEFMSDHHNHPLSLCNHPGGEAPSFQPAFQFHTATSVIMVPEDGLMYVTYGPPCEYEFEEYKL